MFLEYVYKLNPSLEKEREMNRLLEMLRAKYNFKLAERIDAYQKTRIMGEYCDLCTQATIQPLACLTKVALYGDPFKLKKIKNDKTKEIVVQRLFTAVPTKSSLLTW